MKVTAVKATSHGIPINLPLLKESKMESCVCVRVETDEGITGIGFIGFFGDRETRKVSRDLVNNVVGPYIVGRNPMDTDAIMEGFIKRFDMRKTIGMMVHAMSGIDIALWDIKGKALKQPVYRLLGGCSVKIPVYATFGVFDYSRTQLVEAAKIRIAEGHDKLKMLVCINDSNDIPEDAARIKALREGVGDKIQLMIDANQKFSLYQATELCRLIEPYKLTWFEEPVTHNDPREMAVLRSRTSIPLAASHAWEYAWQNRQYMEGRALDIAQTDVAVVGGFTEGIKVAHLAQTFDLPFATSGLPVINMHLIAAAPTGYRQEFHTILEEIGKTVFVNPTSPEKGWVTVPDKPGLGLELNEDALQKYQDK